MAAPTVSSRVVPTGYKEPDGFKTTVSFNRNNAVKFWEQTVTPPGIDGGEPIDTTTMLNLKVRTRAPRALYDVPPYQLNVAYDPDVFTDIQALKNVPDSITVHHPDGTGYCHYGYLRSFMPQENAEGKFPLATVVIVPTNWDYINNVEAEPVIIPAAGT